MTLPEQLRSWRATNGYSQAQAAEKLGISVRTWQQWEQGKRRPRGLALLALERALRQKPRGIIPCTEREKSAAIKRLGKIFSDMADNKQRRAGQKPGSAAVLSHPAG